MTIEHDESGGPMQAAAISAADEWCRDDVHDWFELSYSSYLVLPRTLMQEMPPEWQHNFVQLLEQMRGEFPGESSEYAVFKRDPDTGRYALDELRNYRYPDQKLIDSLRDPNAA